MRHLDGDCPQNWQASPGAKRLDCYEVRKFVIVAEIAEHLHRRGAEVIDIDGVRLKNPEGSWLPRASNTLAVIIARTEAASAGGLGRLERET